MSRIEAGNLTIKKSSCDINASLETLYMTYSEKIRRVDSSINLILKKEIINDKLIINTDKIRLKQILTNLLNNAIKFTEKGFVEFGYKLVKENKSKVLQFYIKDTGIGIVPEKQGIIFDRFMKVEDDKMKLYRGTGLGLSISKAIVNDLGGRIWVKSEIGKGTTFYFTIPLN